MKLNWATGLIIFFIIFVSFLGFILYKSKQYDHSLVMNNYYDEDIKYQQHYDKVKNTADLDSKAKAEFSKEAGTISVTFPGDSTAPASGTILLYNPVSAASDKSYSFVSASDMTYTIPTTGLKAGRWKVKIDWTQNNKAYYQEEEIYIQ